MAKEAVVLIGHGAPASDTPREMVGELKRLESERQLRREYKMSAREAELDGVVRKWPRTPKTDPYKFGVEEIAAALAPKLSGRKLVVAFNEFCAPSVEEAVESLVALGYDSVRLITTMYTRGGIHAEFEIPQIMAEMRKAHPHVSVDYAWPYPAEFLAEFLATQLEKTSGAPA